MTTEHQPDLPETEEPQLPAVITPPQQAPEGGALADFREAFMMLPSDRMEVALEDYSERRLTFLRWLMSQLKEGVHYGYPPGCQPQKTDPKQWQSKPSLYKAGAQFITDLMGVRPEYEADMAAWEQLGSPKETFVFTCRILSRAGSLLGEGRGAFKVGEKKMGENGAIKMCKKRALVDAVLDTWGLADAFTQDLEDPDSTRPKHPNPQSDDSAPQSAPRGERITKQQLDSLKNAWKERQGEPVGWTQFQNWVEETVGRYFDVRKSANWARKDLETCCESLGVPL